MRDEPTQLADVISIGVRAVPGAPRGGGGGGGGTGIGDTDYNQVGEEPTLPPEAWTEEEAADENKRQAECAAKKYNEDVDRRGKRGDEVEHFSLTWTRDGNTVTSEVREATGRHGDLPVGSAVSSTDFNRLSNASGGIPLPAITGYNHSHAADIYCNGSDLLLHDQRLRNQRPSEWDWAFADGITDEDLNHGLVLYVRDCEGSIRAFPYSDRDAYKNGSKPTPDPISPDGCDEAE